MENNSKAITNSIFSGPIVSTTLKMSIPIFISQFVVFLNVLADTFFVSLINKQSTALVTATGLVYPLILIFFNFSQCNLVGTSSVTARSIGEKNEYVMGKIGDSGLVLSFIMSLILVIAGYAYGDNAIRFLTGKQISQETIQYAITYFQYLLPGLGITLITYTFLGMLQGEGAMNFFGLAVLMTSVLNIILLPIMIFVFDMGIKGAALATTIASLLTFLFVISLFLGKKTKIPLKFQFSNINKKVIAEVLKIGLVTSIGMFILNISTMILNNFVGSISEESMNAWILVGRIDQLFLIPAFSIGLTTVTMIGQNYGRKDFERSNRIFNKNLGLCIGICLGIGLIYMLFAPQIFGMFTDIKGVISAAALQVRVLTLTTIGVAGLTVVGCAFQGTGRPIPGLISDSIRATIFSVLLVLPLLSLNVENMNSVYIFVGIGNLAAFGFIFVWGRFYFKKLNTPETPKSVVAESLISEVSE